MLDSLPEDMKGYPATPAAHQLFDIADEPTSLSKEYSDKFNHLTAKLLYLSKIYRT